MCGIRLRLFLSRQKAANSTVCIIALDQYANPGHRAAIVSLNALEGVVGEYEQLLRSLLPKLNDDDRKYATDKVYSDNSSSDVSAAFSESEKSLY
jgi:hypothetical protein